MIQVVKLANLLGHFENTNGHTNNLFYLIGIMNHLGIKQGDKICGGAAE